MADMSLQVKIDASSEGAQKSVDSLVAALQALTKTLSGGTDGLNAFESGTAAVGSQADDTDKSLSVLEATIALVETAFHNAGSAISSFGAQLDSISKSTKKFGRDFSTNVTLPLLALAGLSLKKVFDDAILSKGTATTNAFAGSVQQLNKDFDGLLITIGNQLIPIMDKLIGLAELLIAKYQSLSPDSKNLALNIALVAGAIGPVVLAFSSFIGIIGKVSKAVGTVVTFLGEFATIGSAVVGFVGTLVLSFIGLTNIFLDLKKSGAGTSKALVDTFYLFVTFFNNYVLGTIADGVAKIVGGTAKLVGLFDKDLADGLQGAADFAAGISTDLQAKLDESLKTVNDQLKTIGTSAGNSFTLGLKNGITGVAEEFSKVGATAKKVVTKQMTDLEASVKSATDSIRSSFASGLAGAFIEFSSGAQSASEAFSNFAKNFLKQIAQMILQAQILNILNGFSLFRSATTATGSAGTPNIAVDRVPVATGGFIRGSGTGTSDSIPAWLSNGEFVTDAKTVSTFGADFFHNLKSMAKRGSGVKRKGGSMAFADGGLVSSPGQAPQVVIQNTGTPKDQSSSSYDPSSGITTVILEDMDRNGPISKKMQGTFGVRRGNFK